MLGHESRCISVASAVEKYLVTAHNPVRASKLVQRCVAEAIDHEAVQDPELARARSTSRQAAQPLTSEDRERQQTWSILSKARVGGRLEHNDARNAICVHDGS